MQSRIDVLSLIVVLLVGSTSIGTVIEAATPLGGTTGSKTAASPAGAIDALDLAQAMEKVLRSTAIPEADLHDLAIQLKRAPAHAPHAARNQPLALSVGAQMPFWVTDEQQHGYVETTATLRYVTPHVYMWVQNNYVVSDNDLKHSADRFENQTYPLIHQRFGSEWSPGVDADQHLTVFNGHVPKVGGYYSSSDEFCKAVSPYSNEKEMFYINLDSVRPGTGTYDGILAHEFEHMIHWNIHPNDDTWVNEGLAELATDTARCSTHDGPVTAFIQSPDTQLTDWADGQPGTVPHYGAAHSFMNYILKRFGDDFMRAFVTDTDNGMKSLNKILKLQKRGVTVEDVFADWVVANYIGDPKAATDGRYGIRLRDVPMALTQSYNTYPAETSSTVHQYGAKYYELKGTGDVAIRFQGAPTVKLTSNEPHSGQNEWWSNRGDGSEMTLTRAFDLRGVRSASLNFWTWFDIEDGWDYAYVTASTDGGRTWDTLKGQSNSQSNPSGNSLGWAYTGVSGGGAVPAWIEERMDLTPYAGKKVLLRFEYVTDDAVNHEGFSIDDISIPEMGFKDDAESNAAGWEPRGFVRSNNAVPQHYSVQLIEFGQQTRVRRFDFPPAPDSASVRAESPKQAEDAAKEIVVRGLGKDVSRAVLVISATAPVTSQVAPYHFTIAPLASTDKE